MRSLHNDVLLGLVGHLLGGNLQNHRADALMALHQLFQELLTDFLGEENDCDVGIPQESLEGCFDNLLGAFYIKECFYSRPRSGSWSIL